MITDHVPEGYSFAFQEYLFNSLEHRNTQSKTGWQSFYLLDEVQKKVHASWHIHINGNHANSPLKATFGGPEFSKGIPGESLIEFFEQVDQSLISHGVKTCCVTLAPELLNKGHFDQCRKAFNKLGYLEQEQKVHASIPVENDEFRSIVHRGARTKLNKAEKLGFRYSEVKKENWVSVYDCLYQNRQEKGRRLSLSKDQVKNLVDIIPNSLLFSEVINGDEMIAASISLRVRSDVLYVFYFGHVSRYDMYSPVVYLINGLYDYCKNEGITQLDLGTSATENGTDEGLLNFKKSLGAQTGLKISMMKTYE